MDVEKLYEPVDRNGKLIQAGDRVRIIGIPDLSTLSPDAEADSRPVFEYLVGKYKRVSNFDQYGLAEISCPIKNPKEKRPDYHTVWLEPYLLHLPQARTKISKKEIDAPNASEILESTGFIGCGDAEVILSENYKTSLNFASKTEQT